MLVPFVVSAGLLSTAIVVWKKGIHSNMTHVGTMREVMFSLNYEAVNEFLKGDIQL